MKRGAVLAACLLATLLRAPPGRAADSEEDRARARSYFDAALQAYAAAQYLAAADAFLKAHALLPSPSLIFSAAQAYRRQFFIGQSPEHLREALRLYRDYLAQAEQGRRRQEASEALGELAPFELRFSAAPAEPAQERPTQILVTSRTPGAETSIDGGPPRKVPLVARVAPGEHVAVVRASGYFDETAKLIAVPRETFTLNVLLRPKPVELHVRGDSGANVHVDGQLLTRLPSVRPLMLTGGEHHVTVTQTGHVPYSKWLSPENGERVNLEVSLRLTPQRYASYVTLGLGGASAVVAGVLGGLAARSYAEAKAIDEQRRAGEINVAQRDAFNAALQRRTAMIAGTAIAGSIAVVLGVTGRTLILFDDPEVVPAEGGPPAGGAPARPHPDTELLVEGAGLSLRRHF